MNCKEGDLAMFVGLPGERQHPRDVPYLGRIVRVGKPSMHPRTGAPGWYIFPPFDLPRALDAALRPIRDPGDDARDETLDWLPVPQLDPVAELGLAVQRLEAVNRRLGAMSRGKRNRAARHQAASDPHSQRLQKEG